jgi:pSer/pThr/pTyr-binding forkhead associated (FHA) protein
MIEMLPIEKPKGNYLILEGACEKTKSVMMIKNVPEGGIKLGRGHDCEIRITDISVSRNHALIKFNGTGFYIFDNKSKFGTLVKEDNMNVEVSTKVQQGIQIGRTVVILDMCKESDLKERRESEKELSEKEKPEIKTIGSKRSGDRR